jgi:hypothetical protein
VVITVIFLIATFLLFGYYTQQVSAAELIQPQTSLISATQVISTTITTIVATETISTTTMVDTENSPVVYVPVFHYSTCQYAHFANYTLTVVPDTTPDVWLLAGTGAPPIYTSVSQIQSSPYLIEHWRGISRFDVTWQELGIDRSIQDWEWTMAYMSGLDRDSGVFGIGYEYDFVFPCNSQTEVYLPLIMK